MYKYFKLKQHAFYEYFLVKMAKFYFMKVFLISFFRIS
jgi:hypothetical protein